MVTVVKLTQEDIGTAIYKNCFVPLFQPEFQIDVFRGISFQMK